MIMIPVDEADAFDRVSIAIVKGDLNTLSRIASSYVAQRSIKEWQYIRESEEFSALLKSNQDTFEMVERAKIDMCSACDVDRANYHRYLAKKALQDKFFPTSPITETKTERPY